MITWVWIIGTPSVLLVIAVAYMAHWTGQLARRNVVPLRLMDNLRMRRRP